MKCSVCGCNNLFEVRIIDSEILSGYGVVEQSVKSYACEKCGHVELYVSQEYLDKRNRQIRLKKEHEAKIAELKQKIAAKESEIENIKKIISDENQTVKTVREAKEKLDKLESELQQLEDEAGIVHRDGSVVIEDGYTRISHF